MSKRNSTRITALVIAMIVVVSVVTIGAMPWTGWATAPARTTDQPSVIMEVLDPSLDQYAPLWRDEIARRFPHAVGILVHGGDFVEDQWIVGSNLTPWKHVTPIQEIVRHYQDRYPGRTIVVLACNTGHLRMHIPGVYYAASSVWCVPDRDMTAEMYASDASRHLATRKLDDDPPNDPDDPAPPHDIPAKPQVAPQPSRWQQEPDVVGNIYEFVTDGQ